ncbi:MAG TPA: GNAT family N-acetyltransferase [Vicinamibacterales bacterium]|jgi:RimJ/RimL family protein N-acetyltransferase
MTRNTGTVALGRIRPYRLDDANAVYDAVRESLADLEPWMPWCHREYSIEDSRSWLETQVAAFERGTGFAFAIESIDGRYLGACGLSQLDLANARANVGYWVRSSATRHGVATGAVRLIRDWAFETTPLIRLEIVIAAGNVASHRVAVKAGATFEGTLRNRLVLRGTALDATLFSFTRPAHSSTRTVHSSGIDSGR